MRCLLHGATNFGSSNFGDFLYASEIYDFLRSNGFEADFVEPSDFFIKHLHDYKASKIKLRDADCLIYIPGGYFIQESQPRKRDTVFRIYRYMISGIIAVLYKHPIIILGVGAGPMPSLLFRLICKLISKHAALITVRDEKSKTMFEKLGCANVIDCGDLILSIDYINASRTVKVVTDNSRKYILVHFNHDETALDLFALAVKQFIKQNPEYSIIVASDTILKDEVYLFDKFQGIVEVKCDHYVYSDPYEFIGLINSVDILLTCKLHAGVVACKLNKSVICAAVHPEKTQRFYTQIENTQRCVSLLTSTPEELVEKLSVFKDVPVKIPDSMIESSKQHEELLLNTLNAIKKENEK